MTPPSSRGAVFDTILDELRPYPGRLGASVRIMLCCIIVVVLAMSQQVPEAALSCYLVFFANRDNAATGILIALGLIVAASVGIALGVVFLELSSGDSMVRLMLIAAFTFGGMYLSVATPIGSIGATVGFVFAFALTLEDFVPIPELLSRGLAWMWVVVFFPMAALVLVNCLMGKNPLALARAAIAERLSAAAGFLRGEPLPHDKVARLLGEDTGELTSAVSLGAYLGFGTKEEGERISAAVREAQRILAGAIGSSPDQALASDFQRLATSVERRVKLPPGWMPEYTTEATMPLANAGAQLVDTLRRSRPVENEPGEEAPPPDTFTNPEYLHFALKAMLAVFICYTIYTVGGWFEIHTAMITCFYVALGTTGETLHKATLRIVGCLLGAVMGVGSIIFLMPHMTDIGQLILLVGAVSFIAAWISNGSSLIQYAGWQMALAFYLCVLHSFGPTLDIAAATDRILGILIGNVVVAIVFLSFWPTSVSASIGQHLATGASRLAAALRSSSMAVIEAAVELGNARRLSRLSLFEPRWLLARSATLPRFAAMMDGSETALPEITRLQMLRAVPRFLRGAPHSVKAATQAQEASVAEFLRIASDAMVKPSPKDRSNLIQALEKARVCLRRLGRLERLAPRRAAWRRDILNVIDAYRKLLLGFSRTLGVP